MTKKMEWNLPPIAPILSDMDILDLLTYTEYAVTDAAVSDFVDAAEQVMAALRKEDNQAFGDFLDGASQSDRALMLMRAFYFLGALRGCEAYRWYISPDEDQLREGKKIPFEMEETSGFLYYLHKELKKDGYAKLLQLLGLSGLSTEKKGAAEA